MLKTVEFDKTLAKADYKEQQKELIARLVVLQQQAKQAGLPIVMLVEGWGSAGKGSRISDLVVNLDPRLFSVHTTEDPVGYENRLPFMARFWSRLGAHGHMTIFDQAYYDAMARKVVDMLEKTVSPLQKRATKEQLEALITKEIGPYEQSAQSFENQLINDGYLIVKFFIHISQEEQRRRFVDLLLDPDTSWRVDQEDLRQFQRYEDYYHVYDHLLSRMQNERAPWVLVPGHDRQVANLLILRTLVEKIDVALAKKAELAAQRAHQAELDKAELNIARLELNEVLRKNGLPDLDHPLEYARLTHSGGCGAERFKDKELVRAQKQFSACRIGSVKDLASKHKLVKVKSLDDVTHDKVMGDSYKKELKREKNRLRALQQTIYRQRIPLVMVYEGWDAAGKGGNIKRVASALDARSYMVHPVGSPTPDELAHPFLWRFWTKLPRTGHIAIFDRSWYGRVMVERIEGFARPDEWQRAFDEINDFEADLVKAGALLVKFWVDVSDREQLRRFDDRANTPEKQWKLTDEDWRNRSKNRLYRECVNDMLRLTSTKHAPWHIIESDDKQYARVKALRILNETLEARLNE